MLHITKISFPGLGIGEFSVNSEAFSLPIGEGFSIAWYGIIITFAMILAVVYITFRAKSIGVTVDDMLDFALFVIPFGVIGTRLYYVAMEFDRFVGDTPWETFLNIIDMRDGGLAIYGGIIAGTLTVFLVCRHKKISFPAFGDCVVPGLILAQAIGRWGNFMNGEAHGGETDIFIRMGLDFGYGMKYYHPTFLYESLWNLCVMIFLILYIKHRKFEGEVFFAYLAAYGLGRVWIEGLRTDQLLIPGTDIPVSQVLAAVMIVGSITWIVIKRVLIKKKETMEASGQ